MIVQLDAAGCDAVLGAMASVVEAAHDLTDADRAAVQAANTILFGRTGVVDVDSLDRPAPDVLARVLASGAHHEPDREPETSHVVAALLVVMATVDGRLDDHSTARVSAYAAALGVSEPAVVDLGELATGHIAAARADMLRRNRESITGVDDPDDDYDAWIMPYRDRPDPALAVRYEALGELPTTTFGRTFHTFYAEHGFAFPGRPDAANEAFTTPHDSAHVLSGYDTSVQGELLVSTFTAGMHHDQALAGHILPVIASWHLGIPLAAFAGSTTGALDPRKFFVAWTRGGAVHGDTFRPPWDFWATVHDELDVVRERMQVPPLQPADAADGVTPDWYHPSA